MYLLGSLANTSLAQPSQFVNPCSEASKAAMKCLDQNDYDKSLCGSYFAAVRQCRKIWSDERKREKREASMLW
ncbi:Mitochondrial copper homeostasis protein [Saitoella coloradoensis]